MDDISFDPKTLSNPPPDPVAAPPSAEPASRRDTIEVASPPAGASSPEAGEASAIPQAELDAMTDMLIERLKTVYDPEIPVDIYELGLIYRVDISDDRDVVVDMTLTAPGCPVAGDMPGWVQDAVEGVQGVRTCTVNLTFDPPWDPSRMSDEAKLQLNMF